MVIQAQIVAQIRTRWRIGGQLPQAGAITTQTNFILTTEHAEGLHVPQPGFTDFHIAGQRGAHCCEGHFQSLASIGCATNHLHRFTGSAGYLTDSQFVGIGVWVHGANFTDHHAIERRGHGVNRIHFETRHGQLSNQLCRVNTRTNPLTQPGFTEFHCSPNQIIYFR